MSDQDAPPPAPTRRWSLPKLLALAFAAGVALFVLAWLGSRQNYDFYTAPGAGDTAGSADALPAPLPADVAGGDGASGLRLDSTGGTSQAPPSATPPQIIQQPAAPAPASPPPELATTSSDRALPVPVSAPAPRYPREALRRGISGSVRVRVAVAADGSVDEVEVDASSGNRLLDRAALDAVRRWTFQPATRNGQAVASQAVVPIVFSPGG